MFTAAPRADPTPLAPPGSEHALEARWVTPAEAAELPLRGAEVLERIQQLEAGEAGAPLGLLGSEG